MKQIFTNPLRAFTLAVSFLFVLSLSAVEVEIDGINYDIITKAKQASVVAKSSGKYTGAVVIPESVEYEGVSYAVTSIGDHAFNGCSGLTSVTIGNSVTSIGDRAFFKCSGLTSVTIPNSVTSIEYGAFMNCSCLTSVTIGNSVTSIGNGAFLNCSGLKEVHISDIATWCKIDFEGGYSNPLFDNASHLFLDGEKIKDLVIPEGVTAIKAYAFSGCSDLTSVTIPNSVTSIGWYAFSGCSGLKEVHISDIATWCNIKFAYNDIYDDNDISNPLYYAHRLFLGDEEVKDLIIPEGVTAIKDYAFYNCSALTSVTIPNSVTSIGEDAFQGCSGLKEVHISDIIAWCNIEFAYIDYVWVISNPLYYARHLYMNGEEVTDLIIPEGVTAIKEYAFIDCSGLTSVTIPNSVTSIGEKAFDGCSGLTSVTIPNSVTSIGDYAFSGCSDLTSVTIPNSVTSIGEWAFSDCSGLTSVTIPNSVTSIGNCAFRRCSGLTSVTIPNSVTSIGGYAFESCSGLTSVTIPNSVTDIGEKAFAYCPELTDVYCYAEKVPSTTSDAFEGSYVEYATLHVPTASMKDYKRTEPWSSFGKIVGLSGEGPEQPEQPEVEKCATPVVTYVDGCLEITCETEGAEFITDIADNDIKKHYESKIELSATYNIEVYATKAGYDNSDTVSVALVWVENGEVNEETGVISVPAAPVLVQGNGGILTVSGVVQNTEVVVYTIDGMEVDRAVASDGTATIYTGLQSGTIVVVKFGNKSVKVRLR